MPEELITPVDELTNALADRFEAARIHLAKARRFLSERPLDPENAIKEVTSALESVGRTIYPKASTLGKVPKEMRKAGFPPLMAELIERFWAFASAEPGVRHGGIDVPQADLDDADFCLYVGTALMKYLIDVTEQS